MINLKKCKGPSNILTSLSLQYNASLRLSISGKKKSKYLSKLRSLLSGTSCRSREVEKLLGYLGYASWVEPFGRPFLSALSLELDREDSWALIELGEYTILAFRI